VTIVVITLMATLVVTTAARRWQAEQAEAGAIDGVTFCYR